MSFSFAQNLLPECLSCGVCCFSKLPNYVRVTGSDYARLGELAETLVHFSGNRAYLRMEDGHCAALQLKLQLQEPGGTEALAQWVCAADEIRPAICRELARGSGECLGELEAKRERPIALRRREGA